MKGVKRASVDLGTNTCLLLLAEWDPVKKRVIRVLSDHSTVVRLGEGVDGSRKLGDEPMRRTIECLSRYSELVRAEGIEPANVICVATSQARDAANGHEFFAKVTEKTGFTFKTISGDEEARFTFIGGLLPQMDPSRSAVIDIGGGSTEFMSVKGGRSVDLGSVRFTERFLKTEPGKPVTDQQFWSCQEAIDSALECMRPWRQEQPKDIQLVGVAGTATTLAAWHLELGRFDAEKIDLVTLTRGDLHRMVEELKWRSVEERRSLPAMERGREDVILAGAMILWRAMELLDFPTCRVSTRGLRFGVLS